MEPIAIALIVSVLFNLFCFKEIKTYIKETKELKDKLNNGRGHNDKI